MKKPVSLNLLPHALAVLLLCAPSLSAFAQQKAAKDSKPAAAQSAAPSEAQAKLALELAKPFVTVNGQAQSNARAEVLLREQLARGVSDSPELRQGVRQVLINQALMAQQARSAGFDTNPLLLAQTELAQQNILAQAWQEKVLRELQINDTDLKTEYDRQVAALGDTDYLLRHLLLKEEATAKLLIDKINSGSKIADLSRDYSQDTLTRERGGLTDWANAATLAPALVTAVKTLAKGKMAAQPIKTDAGWHVLQLEDSRPAKFAGFDEFKPQLGGAIARRMLDERLKALQAQARIQ